jgi:nucleoredoxin
MPWLAIPSEDGSAAVKNNLAQTLGIQGIPTLVVIDAKTGEFVTANARADVEAAKGDPAKAKAAIESWKNMERKPLEDAKAQLAGPESPILKFLLFFAKNPIYIFGLMYFYKFLVKTIKEYYGDQNEVPMVEDGDEPMVASQESEF